MASRDYTRLTVEEFGERTIAAGDLDPLYDALVAPGVMPGPMQLRRFLLAYWCFYDIGFAALASDYTGSGYWNVMMRAAINNTPSPIGGRWPRAAERRHFRGDKCVQAVAWLGSRTGQGDREPRLTPKEWEVDRWESIPYSAASAWFSRWPQFGPWITFKAADMLERVAGLPIQITAREAMMYDSPRKSAQAIADSWGVVACEPINVVVGSLSDRFRDAPVPGLPTRKFGFPEVETLLCKFGSHLSGHYPVGNDVNHYAKSVAAWAGVSQTADRLAARFYTVANR